MNKLTTRIGAAVALVAGASALSTGTSFAADAPQIPNQSTQQGLTSAIGQLGNLTEGLAGDENAGTKPPAGKSGLLEGFGGEVGVAQTGPGSGPSVPSGPYAANEDEEPGTDFPKPPVGVPEDGAGAPEPLPPTADPVESGAEDGSGIPPDEGGGSAYAQSSKATAAEANGLPFCPPVKDINLGIEGMHNHFVIPFVGGTIEGVPDIVNDMTGICVNLDYPSSLISPGNEIPTELFSADGVPDGVGGQGNGNGKENGGDAAGLL